MGEVYRARDTKLGREVAIKVLPSDFTTDGERMARFDREARLLASMNHPHVASIYGLEESGETKSLVMELAPGGTIADRLAMRPVSVEEAIGIARQIVDALESAHEKGIIHRDLKPANVMVDEEGKVKVLDFGLAKALDADEGPDSGISNSPTMVRAATQAGMILGTAAYMSPEQAKGKRVDRRADVWAFGVVLFEMLTGQRMFEGETVSETLASVIKEEVPWDRLPKTVPPNVSFLLKRCLTKDPKQRLQSIGEARIILDSGDELLGVVKAPVESIGGEGKKAGLLPWLVAAALSIAVAAVLVLRPVPEESIVMAEVSALEGTTMQFAAFAPGPGAFSPDGRKIAFSAVGEDGKTHLYLRALDEPAARMLPGTEGAQYPFWSPDSRFIAYMTQRDGTLKKVDAAGGPPVTLCDAANGKGGTWSEDGTILFAPDATTPIHRVSASGGESIAVTSIDGSEFNSHRHPRFLPDGRHFLFFARSANPDDSEVLVGSLDGGEPVPVLNSVTQADYANGRLLFVRESTLMAQPFDPDKRELSGEAVPLAEKVAVIQGASLAIFSVSANGALAYTTGEVEGESELELLDAGGRRIATLSEPSNYRHAVISPDASRVAVTAFDTGSGIGDIWVIDVSRNVKSRFTFGPESDQSPVWTPDSRSIIYTARQGETSTIYRKAVGGTGSPEKIYEGEGLIIPTSVSPDGGHLLLTKNGSDVLVLNLDGDREVKPLIETEFVEGYASFSPDGRWITYHSNDADEFHIYVTPFPDTGRRWQVSGKGNNGYPYWIQASAGDEIWFVKGDGMLASASVSVEGGTFEVLGSRDQFTAHAPSAGGAWYSVSPDGEKIVSIPDMVTETDATIRLTLGWPKLLEQR
jgi:Tol biopolymer transport system component